MNATSGLPRRGSERCARCGAPGRTFPQPEGPPVCERCVERADARRHAAWPPYNPPDWPLPADELRREDRLLDDIARRGTAAVAAARWTARRDGKRSVRGGPKGSVAQAAAPPPQDRAAPEDRSSPLPLSEWASRRGVTPGWARARIKEGMPARNSGEGAMVVPAEADGWLAARERQRKGGRRPDGRRTATGGTDPNTPDTEPRLVDDSTLLTAAELAALHEVSPSAVYSWVESGMPAIPAMDEHPLRIAPSEAEAWLREHRQLRRRAEHEEHCDVEGFAGWHGVAEGTVLKWIRAGMPAAQLGEEIRIPFARANRWRERHEREKARREPTVTEEMARWEAGWGPGHVVEAIPHQLFACSECGRQFDANDLADPSRWKIRRGHAQAHVRWCNSARSRERR